MAYKANYNATKSNCNLLGRTIKLKKELRSCAGTFEKGSIVTVMGCGERGYEIEDAEGNRMIEVGFDIAEENV